MTDYFDCLLLEDLMLAG